MYPYQNMAYVVHIAFLISNTYNMNLKNLQNKSKLVNKKGPPETPPILPLSRMEGFFTGSH